MNNEQIEKLRREAFAAGAAACADIPTKEVVQEVEVDPGEGFRLLAHDEPFGPLDEVCIGTGDWVPLPLPFVGGSWRSSIRPCRRPIRLQDKDHRWLDVGEPMEKEDEYVDGDGNWLRLQFHGPVNSKEGPNLYRRVLERGVSKSWQRTVLEPGKWYLIPNIIKPFRCLASLEIEHGYAWGRFEDENGTTGQFSEWKGRPFIPCNPPSTPLEDSEEEYETLIGLKPEDLQRNDEVGPLTFETATDDGWIFFEANDIFSRDYVRGVLLVAPVRRPKSKPDPKASLVWKGTIQAVRAALDNEVVISFPKECPFWNLSIGQKVTVEAI